MPRFYHPQPITAADELLTLSDNAAHHAARVLRMAAGESVTLFDGQGGEWQAQLHDIGKKCVVARLVAFSPDNRSATPAIHLWLPLIKGERLDWALQKATEMGAASIQLYTSERTEVRLKAERLAKKQQQWQHLLISACEQCGLNILPTLYAPQPLTRLWDNIQDSTTIGTRLLALPAANQQLPSFTTAQPLTLLTGPEGGLSDAECQQAQQHGFIPFTLGNRVLRAETAPIALMAAIYTLAR